MRTMTIFIAVVLCLIALAACDKEVGPSAIFTGRVTASDTSVYLADVQISEQSHKHLKTITDSLGLFRLDGVSLETHNIYFEKEGYEPDSLLFEYNGTLTNPIITRHVILYQAGEKEIDSKADEGDSLNLSP